MFSLCSEAEAVKLSNWQAINNNNNNGQSLLPDAARLLHKGVGYNDPRSWQ